MISKRDVARTEIEGAIRSLFYFRDLTCAYVLTWAAYDIVNPVSKARGVSPVEDEFESALDGISVPEWRKIRRRHYNFFKHADRDPDEMIEPIQRELVEVQLFVCILDFQGAFQTLSPLQVLYLTWFTSLHPEFVRPESENVVEAVGLLAGMTAGGTRVELTDQFLKALSMYDTEPDVRSALEAFMKAGRS